MQQQGILVFQTIVTFACIAFVLAAGVQRSNRLSKLMLIVSFLCLIENAAYLMELQAVTTDAAILIMKIRYIGVAFVDTFFFFFCNRYANHKTPRVLVWILILFDTAVMLLAWTCEYHTLFYREIRMDMSGSLPYLAHAYGPIIYANSIYNALLIAACAVIAARAWMHAKNERYRRSCKVLFFCVALPYLIIPIRLLFPEEAYELIPALTAIGMIVFFLSTIVQEMFDISQIARNNIFDNMQEAIVIVNGSYGFVEANAKAREIFPSLVDCPIGNVLPETKLLAYLRTGITNKLYHKESVYDVHIDAIYEEDVLVGYSLLLNDLTDEERQMKRIQTLVMSANEANQAKTDFLASMSHELRTPINSIIGMNEMILREEKNPKIIGYSRDVESAASMLLSLVNDILDSSKIASGKMNILPVRYDLGTMLTELYQMMQPMAKNKGLDFSFDIDATLPRGYIGDDIRIRQVLINLLANAIKYTNEGMVSLRVAAVAAAEKGSQEIQFLVHDSGIGIQPEHIAQIYARFNRMEENRFRHIEGTGLGLNVSESILELMGSRLEVWSVVGKGSDFSFALRQSVSDLTSLGEFHPVMEEKDEGASYTSSFLAPEAQILLVDDNDMNRRVFMELLRETQVVITEAASGQECVDLIEEHHYDMIFLDHMMPGMDGIETLAAMRKDPKNQCVDVPVVMLTANVMAGAKERYLAEGFTDFLSKPILYDRLEHMIVTYLPKEMIKTGEGAMPASAPKKSIDAYAVDEIVDASSDEMGVAESLPEIDEFNLMYARRFWKNTQGLLLALEDYGAELQRMQDGLQQQYDRMRAADFSQNFCEDYRRLVHTLKGTSATVGALLLSKTARLSELAILEGKKERMMQLHPILMDEVQKHRYRLEDWMNANREKSAPQNAKYDLLAMLKNAIDNQDLQTADYTVKQLEALSWQEHEQEVMQDLSEAIYALQFEEAARLVGELMRSET